MHPKYTIVYCSRFLTTVPPFYFFNVAKELSKTVPTIYLELTNNEKYTPLIWLKATLLILNLKDVAIWRSSFFLSGFFLKILLLIKKMQHYRIIVITESPEYHPIFRSMPADITIFDCTDQYYPGEFNKNVKWIRQFNHVFVNTLYMYNQIRPYNACISLISNGYLQQKPTDSTQRKIPNSIVFLGGISRRIDYDLLLELVKILPNHRFFFIGEVYLEKYYMDPTLSKLDKVAYYKWQRLLKADNVRYLGSFNKQKAYQMITKFEVGIIPYTKDDFLKHNSNPMKLVEYLTKRLPVVSTPLPTVQELKLKQILIADTAIMFGKQIKRAQMLTLSKAEATKIFRENNIARKKKQILSFIENYLLAH